jgi:hypothetical protein
MTMGTVKVRNVNHPHSIRLVNADMHDAMKRADLAVLPKLEPGLTLTEIRKRLKAKLPQGLYPSGAKSGWWAKTVQLDLEARGVIKRVKTSPLRLHRS